MTEFEFSIIASGLDPDAEDFADRFFDAGCGDATISFQKGHIIADFAREATSIDAAICSALENVMKAGAQVDRVEPDPLVSLSDIALRTGLSRAAITHYASGNRVGNFPPPVARVTSKTSLYRHDHLSREKAMEAGAVGIANEAIRARMPKLQEALRDGLAAYAKRLDGVA